MCFFCIEEVENDRFSSSVGQVVDHCDVPEPWDKAKGAKINTNLSFKTMDIDKLLLIWLTIHQIN